MINIEFKKAAVELFNLPIDAFSSALHLPENFNKVIGRLKVYIKISDFLNVTNIKMF